jgi:hypothetical protein
VDEFPCTTYAYKIYTASMDLYVSSLYFTNIDHQHPPCSEGTSPVPIETFSSNLTMCIRYHIEFWTLISKDQPNWKSRIKRGLAQPVQNSRADWSTSTSVEAGSRRERNALATTSARAAASMAVSSTSATQTMIVPYA